MNKIIIIGNLTKDPELTTTANGVNVCRFNVAVQRKFTNQNKEKEVDFFSVVAWRGIADNCKKYLNKGSKVAIEGNLQNRTYEDKDGNKKTVTEIIAEEIEFITTKKKEEQEQFTPIPTSELPF